MMFRKKKTQAAVGRGKPNAQPSKNQAVFSYYQNRDSEPDSTRGRGREPLLTRLGQRLRHLPTMIAVGLIVVSVLFALSLSGTPSVKVVNDQQRVAASFLRPVSEYQAVATKLLHQSVLTRNKLTLDTADIERDLQEQFPEITNVAVVLPLISRTPVAYVQVAEPVLRLESGTQAFVIDEKGRALINVAQAGDLKGLNLIPVRDAAQLAIQPGSQVLTGAEVRFMISVRDQLAQKGQKVSRMELPAQAGELNVFIEGKPYYIKFTTTGDPLQQAGTYLALHDYLAGKKITPSQYVDVRVEERAYYK